MSPPPSDTRSLFARLKQARRLPTPPGTAIRVIELCRRDQTEVQEIADAIMCDPVLSARLLKFANSAATGHAREILSIRQAVMLLGLRSVKLAALGFSIAPPEPSGSCGGFDLSEFWAASCATAVVSRHLAGERFGLDREEAFTAGLLSGIGRLAMARGVPDDYASVMAGNPVGTELVKAEREIIGIDHAELGSQILQDWQLPSVLVGAVAYQYEPDKAPEPARPLATLVNVAGALAPILAEASPSPASQARAREAVEQTLGLDKAAWNAAAESMNSELAKMAEVFNVKLPDGGMHDLYAEAQEEATRAGMVAQLERTIAVRDAEELLKRATTDALTGIANRAKFDERLAEMVRGLRRAHGDFALILFDIDHFKKFNDTWGHKTGDLVLTRVARCVASSLRDVDLVARYGGEEFAVLTPATDRRGACLLAARLCKAVEDLRVQVQDEVLSVTISAGAVSTSDYQTSAADPERLVADADAQLYLSKSAGRNTWSYRGVSASTVPRSAAPRPAAPAAATAPSGPAPAEPEARAAESGRSPTGPGAPPAGTSQPAPGAITAA
ncbi:MAG TPA: GGDEF domain-containing protein [Phycisphaerales bacterium]|nr:GGDEF domain-containing protein [Phycisphaerales bacterium]